MSACFIGVDVGTRSVRVGLVSSQGEVLRVKAEKIHVYNPRADFYEQSSSEIWQAITICVREVLDGCDASQVQGIGFDATCSMVVVDEDGQGVSVDPDPDNRCDIIMWMDHRAKKEADHINSLKHSVLDFVGGQISLEMQTPKLLWLKKNLPQTWSRARHFFDLPDFLVWKATGQNLQRSLCSTVCKWTYEVDLEGNCKGWNKSYFKSIGLGELAEESFSRLGRDIVSPGTRVGTLSAEVCKEFGLDPGNKVFIGASLIDAHAGALGMLACKPARDLSPPENQLGLICGTSTCHMVLSRKAIKVPGIWGPYFSAVLPNMWLSEGGQTAVGSLIDHIITTHPAFEDAHREAKKEGIDIQQYLEKSLNIQAEASGLEYVDELTSAFHIWPDFHGNRAPLADPHMTGMVCGLTLDKSVENLALFYLAGVQAVAYGTRHIVDQLQNFGIPINVVCICGGLSKSSLFIQTNSDVLGSVVIRPDVTESVLLGSSMLGAAASSPKQTLEDIVYSMMNGGKIFEPNEKLKNFHNKKYQVFREMGQDQIKYRKIIADLL